MTASSTPPPPHDLESSAFSVSDALRWFKLYGDRTNSLVTLNPDFSDFTSEGLAGTVRYLETRRAVVAAAEPLMAPEDRAEGLARLAAATPKGKLFLVTPVGRELADSLRARGFTVRQAGVEPIFDLTADFAKVDGRFPLARALKRRGGEVSELESAGRDDQAVWREMAGLRDAWLASRSGPPLGFLSRSLPFWLAGERRYFLLRVRGELQGFLAAAPFCRDGAVLGYYFQDIVRSPSSRAGASDLLILEAMRALAEEGVPEVRLGMTPLAGVTGRSLGDRFLRGLFGFWTLGYGFKSLYEFKAKFAPSRWAPLYMACSSGNLPATLAAVLEVHLPDGVARSAMRAVALAPGGSLEVNADARRRLGLAEGAQGSKSPEITRNDPTLGSAKYAASLTAFFFCLHVLRLTTPEVAGLFERSAYVPGNVTWEGVLLGPLFHNHWFHLLGDLLLFFLFGACVEVLLGPAMFWLLVGFGLWLSNPATHAVWALGLERFDPAAWAVFLAERDYGSSNATFALVGGIAALLKRNAWLLGPFFIYGLFICFARNSWLALHHILSMGAGFALVALWLRGRPDGLRE